MSTHSYVIANSCIHIMSSKLSESFTCIFHKFPPMFAVKMSHSGGIVHFFDLDPLPENYESLHLLELIIWQQIHLYNVNHKPGVRNEGERVRSKNMRV